MNRKFCVTFMTVVFTVMNVFGCFPSFATGTDFNFRVGETILSANVPREEILNALTEENYLIKWGTKTRVIVTEKRGKVSAPTTAEVPSSKSGSTTSVLHYKPARALPHQLEGKRGAVWEVENFSYADLGDHVVLWLPNGENLALTNDNQMVAENGDMSWIGYSEKDGRGFRTIITFGTDGEVVGTIITPRGSYKIQTMEEGKTWLVDVTGMQRPESLANDQVLPDGRIMSGAQAPAAGPSFSLRAPYEEQVKKPATISWAATGMDPNLPVAVSFSKDSGAPWVPVGKTKLGSFQMTWKPKIVTENGFLRTCIKNGPCAYANIIVGKTPGTLPSGDGIPPSAPTGVNAVGTPSGMFVFWKPNPEPDIMGYNICVGRACTAFTTTGAIVPTKKGQRYAVSVQSYNASGNQSSPSNVLDLSAPLPVSKSDVQPPTQVGRLSGKSQNSQVVTLSWTKAVDDKTGVVKYVVSRNGQYLTTVQKPTFTDMNHPVSWSTTYTVVAVDKAGEQGPPASVTVIDSSVPPPVVTPPDVPGGISWVANSTSVVTLSWNVAARATGYELWCDGALVGQTAGLSMSYAGLTANSSHSCAVRSYDAAGNMSVFSSSVMVTTLASNPYRVDVMIFYASGDGVTPTAVNNLVAIANQAYVDSGVPIVLRVVHMEATGYVSTTNGQALQDVTNGAGAFASMGALRAQYGADMVVFIRGLGNSNPSSCGLSWINGYNGNPLVASQAFSVVMNGFFTDSSGTYFCADTTFPHELGHAMGLMHDPAHAPSGMTGRHPYSFGFCQPGVAGDVMSYCGDKVFPYFSNPNKVANGIAIGIPDYQDASRSLREDAGLIATLVPPKIP